MRNTPETPEPEKQKPFNLMAIVSDKNSPEYKEFHERTSQGVIQEYEKKYQEWLKLSPEEQRENLKKVFAKIASEAQQRQEREKAEIDALRKKLEAEGTDNEETIEIELSNKIKDEIRQDPLKFLKKMREREPPVIRSLINTTPAGNNQNINLSPLFQKLIGWVKNIFGINKKMTQGGKTIETHS